MSSDYQMISLKNLGDLPKYTATGLPTNFLPNRLSWFFDLNGPSVKFDSACSSSLMALDIACQGLRSVEVEMVSIYAGSEYSG